MAPYFFQCALIARTTLDIGAYVGWYSLVAALANPASRVIALEPLPSVHERLLRNLELNRVPNITPLRTAAGATGGEAEFYHLRDGIPSSSSLARDFMTSQWETVKSTVEVTTIDHLVECLGLSHVDWVKMDTETTEADVLGGMVATLERFRPVVFCEVLEGWGVENRIEELLCPFEYRYYRLERQGPVREESLRGGYNYVFVPRSRRDVESILMGNEEA
jgi:FkbM family methyltransferase